MQLIADSGSTKTQWCVCDEGQIVKQVFAAGINPFYQTEEEIQDEISTELFPQLKEFFIHEIHYYGAGCNFPDKKKMVSDALIHCWPDANITVDNDLLGAARSLFGNEPGIACILGTGSNSCYYDGQEIRQNVSPLGFILGDEGSGAVLGKLLVADCLKNQLPEWLSEKFMDEYELTPAMIMENVYRKPFPNRFLARFAPFMAEHLEEPIIFNQVFDSFDAFFVRNVMQYPLENLQVGFSGSVAYNFRDVLEIVASEHNIQLGDIAKDPMPGLIAYHCPLLR